MMEDGMKRISAAVVLVLTVVLVSACNTMQGMGKDIKQGGEAIEKAAAKK